MEDWQEERTVKQSLYFRGVALVKYRSQLHRPLSGELKIPHYQLHSYYGIDISEIEQVPEATYQAFNQVLQLDVKAGQVRAKHNDTFYQLTPDKLFITETAKVTHEQQEGEELLGYFGRVPVAFQSTRYKQVIGCKEGYPTGNSEQRNDGLYLEYYHADCSTYWHNTTDPQPHKKNQSVKEETWEEIPLPADPLPFTATGTSNQGMSGYVIAFLALAAIIALLFVFTYGLGISGILASLGAITWIALAALVVGIGALISFLSRFPRTIGYLFLLVSWAARLFVLALLLNGLIHTVDPHPVRNPLPDHSEDRSQVEIIDPKPVNPDEEKPTLPADPDLQPDSLREKIVVALNWKSLDNHTYKGNYALFRDEVTTSADRISHFTPSWFDPTPSLYRFVADYDQHRLASLYSMFDSIRDTNQLSRMDFASAIVSMVQSHKYVMITEEDCNDPALLKQAGIRRMRRSGIQCQGHAPFGLRTPLQFLADLKGDCDTRTLLLYILLKHYGYDVAIINSDHYLHSMIGLAGEESTGIYKLHNGKRYYFWETTDNGFRLGVLPRKNGNTDYWNITLND